MGCMMGRTVCLDVMGYAEEVHTLGKGIVLHLSAMRW